VGGVEVNPGDWVVGDGDGLVVVPGAALTEVAAAGRARAEKEAGYFTALRGGATTLDLLSLDATPIAEASGARLDDADVRALRDADQK
jgi:4-hydroxy-4-methyl-2-oxoglutarate aldolase